MDDSEGPMVRPSVPEADRQIGVRVPVLSHGFVSLVDYMGDDAAIVQAARVSYGKGTKSVRDDRGLIRYLMRHRHTTPFEMVEFKFLVRLPIYVARQWIRHRTACLAEGTRVYFDLPGGIRRSGRQLYPIRVEDLWRKFQPTKNAIPTEQRNPYFRRDRIRSMRVRRLNEATHQFEHGHVVDVVRSGEKPVFRMRLEDGKSIECTSDHRFLFEDGWATLTDGAGLREVGGTAVWTSRPVRVAVNGVNELRPDLYRDRAWLEEQYLRRLHSLEDIAEACGASTETVVAWLRRLGIPRRAPPEGFGPGNSFARRRSSRAGIPLVRRMKGDGTEPYADKEWLRSRWVDEGLSCRQIALRCGASVHTIRKWLRVHGLTNDPRHPRRPFSKGHVPWNAGKTYRLARRPMSPAQLAVIRAARAGPASNLWRGGVASDRAGIGRWTTQLARAIHERNGFTCQLCGERRRGLHAHHIVPVWADLGRARDPGNLTTLCASCHRTVHRDELAYVQRLGGPAVIAPWVRRPRAAWNRIVLARFERVVDFEYLGNRMTYDLAIDGPSHNFVANGIVTHNSVNEHSARYSIVPDEFELPSPEDVRRQSGRNRQGRDEALPPEIVERFRTDLEKTSTEAYAAYTRALEAGVARETARLLLPVAYYTQWYWKTNLWNLMHFLSLRLDPHAQDEIRRYAVEIAKLARLVCPTATEAFEEFQLGGLTLSRRELKAVDALLGGASPEAACEVAGLPLKREDGRPMSTGEGVEFLEKLAQVRKFH